MFDYARRSEVLWHPHGNKVKQRPLIDRWPIAFGQVCCFLNRRKNFGRTNFWSGRNDFGLGRNDFELARNDLGRSDRNSCGVQRLILTGIIIIFADGFAVILLAVALKVFSQ